MRCTFPLLGVVEQRVHRVADQVDRGLKAGDQQQYAHRQHLVRLHLVALRCDHVADDVIGRLAAP